LAEAYLEHVAEACLEQVAEVVVPLKSKGHIRLLRHSWKILAAASVAVAAVLVSMCYLGPVIFYDDLMMKREVLAGNSVAASAYMTPILSLFSVTDTAWNWKSHTSGLPRFQAGALLLASWLAFVWLIARRGAVWGLPLAVTGGLILLAVSRPAIFLIPPLTSLDIAQFSYRFLTLFTLAATCAGPVALAVIFRRSKGYTAGARNAAALALVALSLALVSPYLYGDQVQGTHAWNLDTGDVYRRGRLDYGDSNYLRVPPPDTDPGAWTDPGRPLANWTGRPGDWSFNVDLARFPEASGGPPGEVLLEVMHYPGLQDIEVLVDGEPYEAEVGTFWQRRSSVRIGITRGEEEGPGAFGGLKLTGLPPAGILEVRVDFTGMFWANGTSVASLSLLAGAGVYLRVLRRRKAQRAFAGIRPLLGA
jgi:hypothetical protein